MSYVIFFPLAFVLILSALGVVVSRNPIRSALCLVTTLFLLAVTFVFLDAYLVAALQVVVYAGAIMVLFLFVIMLLNLQTEPPEEGNPALRAVVVIGSAAFALFFLRALFVAGATAGAPPSSQPLPESFGTTAALGELLFTRYLLPFEITSLLLLVAIIGAVVMAKRKLP